MCSSTYTLKETGEDTGIFAGYITLTRLRCTNHVNPSGGLDTGVDVVQLI